MSETRIIDAIIGDAKKDAESALLKAKDEARTALAEALSAAQRRADDIADGAKKGGEELRRRALLGAELAARKNALASRRALLEKAYEDAFSALCRLSDADYGALVKKLVAECAETGEESLLVPAERLACCEALLPSLNETMKKSGRKGALSLTASDEARGGVRIVGADADIDCSFTSLLRAQRDEKETEIYKLLFGEKE